MSGVTGSPAEAIVAQTVPSLVQEGITERLPAILALSAFPDVELAITELIETTRNDLRGELSIIAAVALARMQRSNADILDRVRSAIADAVGTRSTGGFIPALRLTYPLLVAGDRAWFGSVSVADIYPEQNDAEFAYNIHQYLAAGLNGDVGTAAKLMVWFEYVDEAGEAYLFELAEDRLPEFKDWLRCLAQASSGKTRPRWRRWR